MNVGTLILFIVIGVPVICGTLIAIAAILKGGSSKKREQVNAEETRLIQQLHQNLNRLEDRLDAIETILVDRERKEKSL